MITISVVTRGIATHSRAYLLVFALFNYDVDAYDRLLKAFHTSCQKFFDLGIARH